MRKRSGLKRFAHRTALVGERLFERIRPPSTGEDGVVIEPYLGFATTDRLVLRGRVLTSLRRSEPDPRQSKWTNIRQMASLFLTDEVAGIEVESAGRSVLTDEEGYFTLHLPRDADDSGWIEKTVRAPAVPETEVAAPVLVPSTEARFAIVSDIDDTVLETGANSLVRNIWTTLTGNATTRRIFPDAIDFLAALSDDGRNPVFYVSSSPWNLHPFLEDVFAASGIVRGPIFLRDLGVSETKFIKGTHGEHKSAAIDILMDAMPDLPFLLVGDTGQHDAEVYAVAAERWPGRVTAVVLRRPTDRANPVADAGLARLETLGIPAFASKDFRTMIETVTPLLGPAEAGSAKS